MLKDVMEGKPIESVVFFRDELADMAWAVERTVPDDMGGGVDGYEKASSFLEYVKKVKDQLPSVPLAPLDPDAVLSYQLSPTEIPENWIPFMPVHIAGSNRDIQFQRSAIPRVLDKFNISLVRPRTDLLRAGLNGTYQSFYFHVQEIAKAGIIVSATLQRTRWYNGKIISWIGRKKTTGRGQGISGLAYDKIVDLKA
jgi:hypothetical protein